MDVIWLTIRNMQDPGAGDPFFTVAPIHRCGPNGLGWLRPRPMANDVSPLVVFG